MRVSAFMKYFLAMVLTLAVVGCSKKTTPQTAGETTGGASAARKLSVAVIPKSTGGDFWGTVEKGARQAAEDLDVEIRWEGTLSETEIAEQIKIIDNMLNLEVDGLALAPLNQVALKKPVANVAAEGIPVVIFDSAVDGAAHKSFVATDNEKGGGLAGKHMVALLGDAKGDVLVLRYVQGTGSTEARAKGFIDTLKEAGISIVADPYPTDGSVQGAKTTAVNTLETYVKDNKLQLDGVFACNLYSALGMLEALDDLRKAGVEVNAKFIGFDTNEKLLAAVANDTCAALISQNPEKMGYLAVETTVKLIRGEAMPDRVDTGVELVTKTRLAEDAALRELVGLK